MTRAGCGSAPQPPTLTIIVETPKGSRNKLKYEPSKRMFKLSKVLPEGMVFPYDFGFVPGTKADDGDPLDVLVLSDEPLFPGCLADCTLLGAIELEQEEGGKRERNDRLVAATKASLLYSEVKTLAELNPVIVKQIEKFFVNYQKVLGVRVKILGRAGPDKAQAILRSTRAKK